MAYLTISVELDSSKKGLTAYQRLFAGVVSEETAEEMLNLLGRTWDNAGSVTSTTDLRDHLVVSRWRRLKFWVLYKTNMLSTSEHPLNSRSHREGVHTFRYSFYNDIPDEAGYHVRLV